MNKALILYVKKLHIHEIAQNIIRSYPRRPQIFWGGPIQVQGRLQVPDGGHGQFQSCLRSSGKV